MSNAFSGATGSVTISGMTVEIKNWNISHKADAKESTSTASAGIREYKSCARGWDGSFETQVYPGDCVGSAIAATFATGTGQPGGGTGTSKSYAGTVILTESPVAVPYDDLVKWSMKFQGSGPLTIS